MGSLACAASGAPKGEGDRERIEPKGFLYGLALNINSELYKGVGPSVMPLPLIGYRSERLRVFGPFVSYTMAKVHDLELSVEARPSFAGYEASDSKIFDGMEKRRSSMDLGLGLGYKYNNWKWGVTGVQDVLARSHGAELSTKLSRVYRNGPVFIEPSIGLSYLDSDYVDYYYGVQRFEARIDRPEYQGKSVLNKKAGISITTPIFFNGLTRFGVENTWFGSSVANSPLTDSDDSYRIFFSFSKFFE